MCPAAVGQGTDRLGHRAAAAAKALCVEYNHKQESSCSLFMSLARAMLRSAGRTKRPIAATINLDRLQADISGLWLGKQAR